MKKTPKPRKPKVSQCCNAPMLLSFPEQPNSGFICTSCISLTRPKK